MNPPALALRRRALLANVSLAAFAACAVLWAPPVSAKELAGVKLDDAMTLGEKSLKLNGLGLRKKAIFKVYVGGLYLEAPAKSGDEVLKADTARVLVMHWVRSVEKPKIVEGYTEGFQKNGGAAAQTQKANIDKFYGMLADAKDGDRFSFAYEPGKGTTVSIGGVAKGTIEGKEFADLLFSVWLGPQPPSEDFKKGLLGQ